jgi:hypothetical protein
MPASSQATTSVLSASHVFRADMTARWQRLRFGAWGTALGEIREELLQVLPIGRWELT